MQGTFEFNQAIEPTELIDESHQPEHFGKVCYGVLGGC